MSIARWEPGEGPRDKLLERGGESLSDAEVLAILLHSGYRGCSAVQLGRDLLARFGGLAAVLEAGPERLLESPGVGPAKYARLLASLELGRRHALHELSRGET